MHLSLAPNVVKNRADAALRALDRRQVQVLPVLPVPEPCTKHALAVGCEEPLDFIEDCRRNGGVLDLSEKGFNPAVAITLFRQPPTKFVERKHGILVKKHERPQTASGSIFGRAAAVAS